MSKNYFQFNGIWFSQEQRRRWWYKLHSLFACNLLVSFPPREETDFVFVCERQFGFVFEQRNTNRWTGRRRTRRVNQTLHGDWEKPHRSNVNREEWRRRKQRATTKKLMHINFGEAAGVHLSNAVGLSRSASSIRSSSPHAHSQWEPNKQLHEIHCGNRPLRLFRCNRFIANNRLTWDGV